MPLLPDITLHYILFFLLLIVCFLLPGLYLIKSFSNKLTFWEKNILGIVTGFTFFTLIAYILLLLKISFLLFPIILLINLASFREIIKQKLVLPLLPKGKLLLLFIVFIIGIIGQLLIISPSGLTNQNKDLVFWSANGHDGAWHIALMEEIKNGYPLQNPVLAGEKLTNYHFFSDIAPAEFSRFPFFSPLDLYFRLFPFFFSLLLGSLAYLIGKKIGGSYWTGLWTVIFTYFGGSFGYIVTLMNNRTIGGESIFWATQIQSSSGNPPQIAAFIILLAFLYLFIIFTKEKSINWILLTICTLLAGSLLVFKVYAGVVILGSLTLLGIYQILKERRFPIFLLSLSSILLALVLYLPNTTASIGFLIWEPWWYIRTMIVVDGRLNWLDLELKRQTYLSEHNLKRVVQIELTGFIIFLVGNLGTRILGFWQLAKNFRSVFNNYTFLLLISISLMSFIFPLLFLQKGVASNTIQFMQYFLLIFGIAAAITVTQIISKIKWLTFRVIFILIIIILTIPTQVGLIYSFYSRPPLAKITSSELEALSYLKKNTNKNILIITPAYNKYLSIKEDISPIWSWFDTAYVAAFSGRRTYLADTEQVDIMGYKYQERLRLQTDIFKETDPNVFIKLLQQNNINYLYFPKILRPVVDLDKTNLNLFYKNKEVEIWKVY